ncbi:MAG: AAA family ATPase, partial [Planctomycetes bacterium]|nr:AAA family ATPase [Planctomycetota bacterium]
MTPRELDTDPRSAEPATWPAEALTAIRALNAEVLDPMKQRFVGKSEIIDLLGIALVAGENLFLLGPPGTAKSALVREFARRIAGRSFEYLLTRFTEPNEIFGPFDIRRLREGELVTNTTNMLPEADLVFLDELLNANSAILNSLLTVLNERVLRRGLETFELAVLSVIGASNRLPEDEALGALFDRFLIRVRCDNVEPERLADVLDAGWRLERARPIDPSGVTPDAIRSLAALVSRVDLSVLREDYVSWIARVRQAGIPISDRRAVKLQRLVAASAILCGRSEARHSDLWVLRHTWDTEEQEEILASIVDHALVSATDEDHARHPQSHRSHRPDPEVLARDLEAIAAEFERGAVPERERVRLVDRLSTIEDRAEWI